VRRKKLRRLIIGWPESGGRVSPLTGFRWGPGFFHLAKSRAEILFGEKNFPGGRGVVAEKGAARAGGGPAKQPNEAKTHEKEGGGGAGGGFFFKQPKGGGGWGPPGPSRGEDLEPGTPSLQMDQGGKKHRVSISPFGGVCGRGGGGEAFKGGGRFPRTSGSRKNTQSVRRDL